MFVAYVQQSLIPKLRFNDIVVMDAAESTGLAVLLQALAKRRNAALPSKYSPLLHIAE